MAAHVVPPCLSFRRFTHTHRSCGKILLNIWPVYDTSFYMFDGFFFFNLCREGVFSRARIIFCMKFNYTDSSGGIHLHFVVLRLVSPHPSPPLAQRRAQFYFIQVHFLSQTKYSGVLPNAQRYPNTPCTPTNIYVTFPRLVPRN